MASIDPSWFTGIIDISHHQHQSFDWNAVRESGIAAIIHKATEGRDFEDARYHQRRSKAKAAGLLWGSYHFSGPAGSEGEKQADHYWAFADPEPDEFICFDCEKHGTFENMLSFVQRIRERAGRYPAIYGRRLLRELMEGNAGSDVSKGVLWYDEYPPHPHSSPRQALPDGWKDWTLWQYTNGHSGPDPKEVPQVGRFDRNAFRGSETEFRSQWPFSRT